MPTRRQVLGYATAGLAAASLAPATAAATTTSTRARPGERPNVLWLVSEDNGPFLGAYGDPVARTPTLDALAREGIRYARNYSSYPVCAPSRFSLITGVCPESMAPAGHMRAEAALPGFMRGFPEYLREAGYYCTNNGKTDYNADVSIERTWDDSSDTAHWRNRPAGVPFFAVFNDMTTHESVLHGTTAATSPDDIEIPAYLPDTKEIRADYARYYDALTRMDANVAARLKELEDDGLAEDTIVFYYADNGGVLPRSKRFCYEEGLRTPLIVRVPEKWSHLAPHGPGTVVTGAVTQIDYAPTVLALAGVEAREYMQGKPFMGDGSSPARRYAFGARDRMDERYDMMRTVRDERYRYIRNYAPHRPWGQHVEYMMRAAGYRSWEQSHLDGTLNPEQDRFWGTKPAEELYDLETDPDQVRNLAEDPRCGLVLRRLRRVLDEHLIAINDNGFIPEGSPLEGWYESRRRGAYPIRKVLRLARTAIERDARHIDEFRRETTDDNEVVRYWAVQGCLMLGPEAATASGELLTLLRGDPSPQVRIVAAETLLNLRKAEDDALARLCDMLSAGNESLRLQAVNALTYIDADMARSVRSAISDARDDAYEEVRKCARYLLRVIDGTYVPGP